MNLTRFFLFVVIKNSGIHQIWLLLVDPEGKVSEQRRHEAQSKFEKLAQSLLVGEGIPADNWTTSLQDVPALTHAVVEQEECANSNVCILQSFVPESKKSKYFLIRKNISFVLNCFLRLLCNSWQQVLNRYLP